jgi:hypothetical protein
MGASTRSSFTLAVAIHTETRAVATAPITSASI